MDHHETRRQTAIAGTVLALACILLTGVAARAEGETPPTPASPVARAEALLDAGHVEEAARAFAEASRAAPRDAALRERALVLRRVVSLRRFVAERIEDPRWLASAVALHAFYLDEELNALALDLAKKAHGREDSSRTAVMLAESHLALGQDREAAALLAARQEPEAHERILNAVALARLDHDDAARGLATNVTLPGDAPAVVLQDLARVYALVGERDEALGLLRQSFERTPVPALEAARARVRRCPDFVSLRETEAFGRVLATASKVKQTCSGGSTCATCPNRGGCGGG